MQWVRVVKRLYEYTFNKLLESNILTLKTYIHGAVQGGFIEQCHVFAMKAKVFFTVVIR